MVDEINKIGSGFNFNKDFVLKSCLVLSDFADIAFKVDNFNSKNMTKIENNWDNIAKSIQSSVLLLSSYGYNRDTLTSNNAVIPIVYYLNKIGNPPNYELSVRYKDDREKVFQWLTITLLKRAFGGQPDNILRPIRQVIKENNHSFPINAIVEKLKGSPRSISFSDEEIDNLLDSKWGQKYTFSILSLLYPTLDYRNKFHIDHIYPRSILTYTKLTKRGIPEDKVYEFMNKRDSLANLQLLEGLPNQEKSGKDFNEWVIETYPSLEERRDYLRKNHIPDTDLSLTNFINVFKEREGILRNKLTEILMLKM